MAKKKLLFDPTFTTLQQEPPNTLGSVVEFKTTAASTIDFRGAERLAYPVTQETFSPSEPVTIAELPQCTVFQKTEYLYPSRYARPLDEFRNKPASLFLRYILKENKQWYTYEYGIVQAIVDSDTLSVLCDDLVIRSLPVEYQRQTGKASLFQVGDSVLIFCATKERNRIVIGWACMLPRSSYTWGIGFLPGLKTFTWANSSIPSSPNWPIGHAPYYSNFWGWEGSRDNDFGSRDMDATNFELSLSGSIYDRVIDNFEVIFFPKSTMQAGRELTTDESDSNWAYDLIPPLTMELYEYNDPVWVQIVSGACVGTSMARPAWYYNFKQGSYYIDGTQTVTVQNAHQQYSFSSGTILQKNFLYKVLLKNKAATKRHYDRYWATWRDVFFNPGYGGHQIAGAEYPARYWDATRGLSVCGHYV